jgi:hypothetical protein
MIHRIEFLILPELLLRAAADQQVQMQDFLSIRCNNTHRGTESIIAGENNEEYKFKEG